MKHNDMEHKNNGNNHAGGDKWKLIISAIFLCLVTVGGTACNEEDDDPLLVSEAVMKEAKNYQRTLNELKAQFEYLNKVYPFSTDERETISQKIDYVETLIKLKIGGTVDFNGSEINLLIENGINDIKKKIQYRRGILITLEDKV